MSKGTFERKKTSTSNFPPASLVSPHTPTLANPVRGFGLATNNVIQAQTLESTNQQAAQPAEESLLSQAIGQRSFSHDISRIALRRPQAKLTVGKPGDKYEQEADEVATHVMRMVMPDKFNTPSVQLGQNSLQRKCAACEKEEEEEKIQRLPDLSAVFQPGIQRWSLFGDEEDKQESQSSSSESSSSESSSSGGILDWAKDKAGGAVDTVTQAGSDAVDWAKDKAGGVVDTVTQAGSDAVDWAKDKAGGAVDTVTQAGSDAVDWAKDKASGAVDTLDTVTDSGRQALDLISNWRSIQVDWNSEQGMILRSWASKLDPEIVLDISSKSPADLYNVVDVPSQVQEAAKELAKQVRMDVTPGYAPSPNIPLPDIDIPGIPGRKPPSKPAPNPSTEPSPTPGSPSGPSPLLFLLLLVGIIIFLAILYYGNKKKVEVAPGSGYQGGGGTSGGGGSSDTWEDEKLPEDEKPGGCSEKKFDQEYLTAKELITESEGYRNKYGAGVGHTIKEHVGKKQQELCERACDPKRKAITASTFKDRSEADTGIQNILNKQYNNIKKWATDPAREIGDENIFPVPQTNVGTTATVIDKNKNLCKYDSGKGVKMLVIFDPTWKLKKGCFWLLTGHPTK